MSRRTNPWRPALLACGLTLLAPFALGVPACSGGPAVSDTKTNWLKACDADDECGEFNCLCGLCTLPCAESADCSTGVCNTGLASIVQCQDATSPPPNDEWICLPEPSSACTESPLLVDDDLGPAVSANCPVAGALICEDFDAPFREEYSTYQDLGGSASIQDCLVHSGSGAARYLGQDEAYTQTRIRLPAPVADGALYARFFARITKESQLAEWQLLFEFWHSEVGGDTEPTTLYVTQDGRLQVYNGPTDTVIDAATMPPLTRDEWHCIELSLIISPINGSVGVAVAGTTVAEQTGIDTAAVDPLLMAVIGSKRAPGDSAGTVELLIDDLVVGTEPIGCE